MFCWKSNIQYLMYLWRPKDNGSGKGIIKDTLLTVIYKGLIYYKSFFWGRKCCFQAEFNKSEGGKGEERF